MQSNVNWPLHQSFSHLRSMYAQNSVIILGIDPGTVVMGYAVIECKGKSIVLHHMDALRMSWTHDVFERLQTIYETIDAIIDQYKPTQFAIEAPFFGKNVQSMLKLGRAQGVAIACAMRHQLSVTEYSPKKVKQSITGNGNAQKEQVWSMLERTLQITEKPKGFDASDALAVAVCHFYQSNVLAPAISGKKLDGWAAFLKQHPEKLVVSKK